MTLPLELGGIRDPSVLRAFQEIAKQFPVVATGGGGGAPSGPAGGVLGGTYPNPAFAVDMATQAELDAHTTLTATAHGGIVASTDARLTNARTPTAHATSHQPGGSDAMAVDAAAATGSLRTLGTTATSAAAGNRGMPVAGTAGQALVKNTATDYDASWTTLGTGGPPSGAAGGDLAGTYPNPTLAARPYWMLRRSTATASIAATSGTLAIPWDVEDADTFGLHAANATDIVIARAGVYLVGFQLASAGALLTARIRVNGAEVPQSPGDGGGITTYRAQGLLTLAATNTVQVFVTNPGGSAQTIIGSTTSYQAAKFYGWWIGP